MEDLAHAEVTASLTTQDKDKSGVASFHTRTIGPEPPGATPIADEDLEGLIPSFVTTRADLNLVEYENIAKSLPWALRKAVEIGPFGVLEFSFLIQLHKAMFNDVWKWAGTLRRRVTNIGVEPSQIVTQTRISLDDAAYWASNHTYSQTEIAVRIHSSLVKVHPFPNGNGRTTRLMADLYLISIDQEPLPWGGTDIGSNSNARKVYIAALVQAVTTDEFDDLLRFARGTNK